MTRAASPTRRAEIAARYKAGATLGALAQAYGYHRATVSKYIVGEGVQLRPCPTRGRPVRERLLDAVKRAEMATKYRYGMSVRELARAYGVAYGTAHGALAGAGVTFRQRGAP